MRWSGIKYHEDKPRKARVGAGWRAVRLLCVWSGIKIKDSLAPKYHENKPRKAGAGQARRRAVCLLCLLVG